MDLAPAYTVACLARDEICGNRWGHATSDERRGRVPLHCFSISCNKCKLKAVAARSCVQVGGYCETMLIRFVYSVGLPPLAGGSLQMHGQHHDIEVVGAANAAGDPSYRQLAEAERKFLAWFLSEKPAHLLLQFETVPADGTKGRFSEYRAFLPAN